MYDQLSASYDKFVNWENRLRFEMPFLTNLLSQVEGGSSAKPIRVLDAACGTAMHAIALAKRGYDCSAADLSSQMIQQAKQNAIEQQVSIRCETVALGEMAVIFGTNSFQAVLCLGNSLPHLLTEKQLQAALEDFYALLSAEGVLIIQNRNFEPVLAKQQREMEPQAYQDQDREELYIRFYDFLADGCLRFNFLTLSRRRRESWQQSWHSSLLKPYLQQELGSALHRVGFTDMAYYGSLAGEMYDPPNSGNLVIVAWKRQ